MKEQRYRRHFLDSDLRQDAMVMAIVSLALYVTVRNDFLLLRGTSMLRVALAAKAVHLLVAPISLVLVLRAKWPRQHDRALALFLFLTAAVFCHSCLNRAVVGEFQGPLICVGALHCFFLFALRGPVRPRALTSGVITAAALLLLWIPQSNISPAAKTTGSLAVVALNVIGILSARSFENARRKSFEAERHERRARRELADKIRELAAEKERAEAMSRTRTAFLAAMSHEFRTPMNAVIGLSDLLVDAPQDEEYREHARTIRDSARALLALLNDILDFAKIDAQKLTLSPLPFDARRLSASVIEMLRPAAEARSITLSGNFSTSVPDWLVGDDARLRQVLVNLLSNAIKFTQRGAVGLRVTGRALGEGLHEVDFRVEDSGIGMTPDVVARLFRPFEQADGTTTRRYGGTGLGLAISKQIVTAMGGEIHVESEHGRGSVFTVTLKLAAAPTPATITPLPRVKRPASPPLVILLVDDQPINRRVALATLGRLGYRADVACSGPEALLAVSKKEYDVVLMDLQMPGMSGIEATAQIAAQLAGKRLPYVIAMTASVFEEDRNACLNAGMRDFIGKPIDVAAVDAALSRVMEERGIFSTNNVAGAAIATLATEPLEKLRQLESFGEPGFFASLCREFMAETPDRIRRMEAALVLGDTIQLEIDAHGLKSTSGSLGATELSELCARIEAAAREGRTAEVGEWLSALSPAFIGVERALAREIA